MDMAQPTPQRTPLYVIGGSLGSGKTTLLRRLLEAGYGRLAVIVNEFGEIGVDGRLVEGRDIEMVELAGGCVCCSLAGEFAAGVRELLEKASPEAILVETTGVAEADALVEDIEDDLPEVRLEALVVLVDADTAGRFPALGYVERNQLAAADLVLLNKTDLVDAAALERLRERIADVNAQARVLETVQAAIDPALLLARHAPASAAVHAGRGRDRAAAATASDDAHGRDDHGMESFVWHATRPVDRAAFERAVAGWPRDVYRAKGVLRIKGEPMLFNYVAGRWQLEPYGAGASAAGAGETPALVVIGPGIGRCRDDVIRSLEACLV